MKSFYFGLVVVGIVGGLFQAPRELRADDFDDFLGPQAHESWKKYMRENRYTCPGPLDTLAKSRTLVIGGKSYVHSGYKLELLPSSADKDDAVKIGVVSAIKDTSPGTMKNLKETLAWFVGEKVDWIVVNGDIARGEFDLEEIIDVIAATQFPILVNLGNLDSKGSWARVYKNREKKNPHIVNGVWIRQIIADDIEFWTVAGYHDSRFVHQGGGCKYKKADVDVFRREIKPSGDRPVAMVVHGPPLGQGKKSIDVIHDNKNVGDPNLNRVIRRMGVKFGIFGHILESGGRAVRSDMKTRVKEGVASDELHLNSGSVSADPWAMLGGKTFFGMSVIMEIKGGKASFKTKRFAAQYED